MRTSTTKPNDAPFRSYFPIGEAVSTLLHPFAEVDLHDIESGRIVRIWNSFSRRKASDLSHLEDAPDLFADQDVLGPYEKALSALGRTKSITAAIRNDDGETIGYFCINLDVSVLDNVISRLGNFVALKVKRPEKLYKSDLQEHVNYVVHDYLLTMNKRLEGLSRNDRIQLVKSLNEQGIFQSRNSMQIVSKSLNVSRSSVYNLLADALDRENISIAE